MEHTNKELRRYQTKKSKYVKMSTLPIGTKFYVCNGDWHGRIIQLNNGNKAIANIHNTIELSKDNDDYSLEIEVNNEN